MFEILFYLDERTSKSTSKSFGFKEEFQIVGLGKFKISKLDGPPSDDASISRSHYAVESERPCMVGIIRATSEGRRREDEDVISSFHSHYKRPKPK